MVRRIIENCFFLASLAATSIGATFADEEVEMLYFLAAIAIGCGYLVWWLTNQQPAYRRKFCKIVVPIAIPAVALFVLWQYRSTTVLAQTSVPLEKSAVSATVYRLEHLQFLDAPHFGPLISFGNSEIRTRVRFPDGHNIRIISKSEPRSLWNSNGTLYLICGNSSYWEAYKFGDRGVVSITRSAMPPGLPPWNLQPDDRVSELNKEYSGESESLP